MGCRGPVPLYNHLWVAVAAEGSGDMLPFFVLVSDRGADFSVRVSRVQITAVLWVSGWCEAKSRYRSVWVFLRKTVVDREPSSCRMTFVSRNGIEPSDNSSTVNWMEASMELTC